MNSNQGGNKGARRPAHLKASWVGWQEESQESGGHQMRRSVQRRPVSQVSGVSSSFLKVSESKTASSGELPAMHDVIWADLTWLLGV